MVKKLSRQMDTIVVFDEAHNIDDVCLESYTIKINNQLVNYANTNIRDLESKLEEIKEENRKVFRVEFDKMLQTYSEKLGKTMQ
jgi:DNA excision repair protein ERCC-2